MLVADNCRVLRLPGMARHGVADAMYKTAEAITQCKFEATDPASDEVVLYKILQVHQMVVAAFACQELVVQCNLAPSEHVIDTALGPACTLSSSAVHVEDY